MTPSRLHLRSRLGQLGFHPASPLECPAEDPLLRPAGPPLSAQPSHPCSTRPWGGHVPRGSSHTHPHRAGASGVWAPPLSLALSSACQDQAPCGQPPDSSLTLAPYPQLDTALNEGAPEPWGRGGSWGVALWGMEPQGSRGRDALWVPSRKKTQARGWGGSGSPGLLWPGKPEKTRPSGNWGSKSACTPSPFWGPRSMSVFSSGSSRQRARPSRPRAARPASCKYSFLGRINQTAEPRLPEVPSPGPEASVLPASLSPPWVPCSS